jgi:hypothetical protein
MATAAQRFSISDIEKLKYMASFGHDGRSIARALDRSAQSVRVKAVELGVSLRKPLPDHRCIKLSPEASGRLGRLVIETVVNNKLINAIIDDAPPKKHQMATSRIHNGRPLCPRMQAAASVTRGRIHAEADRNASERAACRIITQ